MYQTLDGSLIEVTTVGELSLARPKGGGLLFVYNYLACVASVSLWFRVKERGRESETARKMAQVKERGGSGEERKRFLPFPPPFPFFHFLALVPFLARPKPKIPFLVFSHSGTKRKHGKRLLRRLTIILGL